ncbi:hypothetical protein SAMN05216327_110138 [Dyadobacter sp. SG02]|uniref:hypothetical protein n=1 Tax=Dyadobacter sp. SG02 TaxID=1855291 RepID=UPI0008C6E864|nr:hypothetical protein [Dyadobacter sp. SG02]SEJ44064.1 hypothetical protein SAMN05216327_110138 [Dyadobacter sp. SG02]
MRRLAVLITLILASFTTQAQDTLAKRASYIGLDVINSLPSFIFPDKYYIRNAPIIEPYYMRDLKKPGRRLYFGAGFASGDTHQYTDFSPSQAFKGTYLRAAYEVRRMRSTRRILYAGYGPVISIAGYHGKFHFNGPTFGDYEGRFKETNNVAFGIEGYFGFNFNLANNWLLRLTFRNVMGRRTAADTYVQYFPGFGYTIEGLNNRFLYSGGLSLQIHYKIR